LFRFIFSPEGTFFRSFLLDEVVKSIDALSREQLVLLVSRLGLQGVQLPVLLPGAKQAFVPLSPSLSEEDRRVVENVVKIGTWHSPVLGRGQQPSCALVVVVVVLRRPGMWNGKIGEVGICIGTPII
jgi:aarF domain-containing kinase